MRAAAQDSIALKCLIIIFQIIPPHAVALAAANGSFLPQSAPVSSQPTNSSPASTSTDLAFSVSAQDERALANTCCAGDFFLRISILSGTRSSAAWLIRLTS